MHPNPTFRKAEAAQNSAFAKDRSFGMLAVNAQHGPLISHIPFELNDDGTVVDLHLVRSNPILKALPGDAVIAVQGPDAYISPDWYDVADQVPTWNYVAVHLRGTLNQLAPEALPEILDRLSAQFESRLAPKSAWLTSKMTPDVLQKMQRMIVPCRLSVTEIAGTWKLNQNKDDDVRLRAADAVENSGVGSELAQLAALMRAPPR